MGYDEAKKDGVKCVWNPETRVTHYYPRCTICGQEMFSYNYKSGLQYICKDCKEKQYLTDKRKKAEESKEIKDRKFEHALKRIEKAVGSKKFLKYEAAIAAIKKKLYKDGWFDSTEEIMVAIELVKNNIRARHQVKMGGYRVDFLLPDQKVVLEVDGTLFHTDKTKERERVRDNSIVLALGAEWEVIRITDECINEDISKLIPTLKRVLSKRRLYRRELKGKLPSWYNDRE